MRIAVLLALMSLLVGGCGSETGAGDASDEPSRRTRASGGQTELTVVVKPGAGQERRAFTLTCDPAGGDHPDPEAACAALDELDEPFATVPADQACTEIYGGPQTARVTGTYRGEPVDTAFDRTNGCGISRWDAHVALLVERGGADGS